MAKLVLDGVPFHCRNYSFHWERLYGEKVVFAIVENRCKRGHEGDTVVLNKRKDGRYSCYYEGNLSTFQVFDAYIVFYG